MRNYYTLTFNEENWLVQNNTRTTIDFYRDGVKTDWYLKPDITWNSDMIAPVNEYKLKHRSEINVIYGRFKSGELTFDTITDSIKIIKQEEKLFQK